MPYKDPAIRKAYLAAYNQRNKERLRLSKAAYRKRQPAKSGGWRKNNPERVKEIKRKYYMSEKGKAQTAKASKKWRAAHLEQSRAAHRLGSRLHPQWWQSGNSIRRARKLNNGYEKYSRADVIKRDRSICHICQKKVPAKNLVLDHLIPISKGGSDTFNNVAVAHRRCNLQRGTGRIPAQLLLGVA